MPFPNMASTPIDTEEILKQYGGFEANNLAHLFDPETEENELDIIENSPYYSTQGMIESLQKFDGNFTLLTLNSQSLYAKISDLDILIQQFNERGIEIGAICIQETWLPPNSNNALLYLDNFNLITQGYSTTTHGGLAIYVNSKYNTETFFSINESLLFEALFVKISAGDLQRDLVVGNIYKPPHNNNNNDNIENFIEELRPLLDKLNSSKSEIAISGDFNIDLLKINARNKYFEFFDLMVQNSFFPKITLPTRFAKYSCSLLDNILCKYSDAVISTTSGILLNNISDHLLCFTSIKLAYSKNKKQPKQVKQKIDTQKAQESFLEELKSINIYGKMNHSLDCDPNTNYKILTETVQKCRKKHFPSTLVKFNKRRHKGNKWITYGIIKSINKRDKMYRELQSLPITDPYYLELKQNLSIHKSILKKSIRDLKTNYYHGLFEKYKSDIKNTWKTISEIFNKANRKKNTILKILKNGKTITDSSEIANEFNSFFANIGPLLASNLEVSNKKPFQFYLKHTITSEFCFKPIDSVEIEKIIRSLKSKTSFGYDEMTTKSLKKIAPVLLNSLTLIINQSLLTGIFPDDLKIAKVIPLYKKDDPSKMDNYRPVSLLPALSKVFERVVHTQVYDYFQENGLFFKSQYGFRGDHSTELAALELVDRVNEDLDEKKTPVVIFMDLSKAFDTLDHHILLTKLKHYGLNRQALSWFKSYLSGRQQFVEINGVKSNFQQLTTGVPQGSVLGPLLFLIYMNDIPNSSEVLKYILFADDTSLIDSFNLSISQDENCNIDNLNNELAKIYEWLTVNKLSLNVSKTKFMAFHHPNKRLPNDIHIKINDIALERVQDFCFLGLTINENLKWKTHIDKVSNKVSKITGILNKLKHFLPQQVLRSLYCSLIQSQLNYCILAWGFDLSKLEKSQKKSIRTITCSRYNAHTEPLFKALNLLKIKDIFILNMLKFYQKLINNRLPSYFNNFRVHTMGDIHSYNTRSRHTIPCNVTRTVSAQRCVRNKLPVVLNNTNTLITSKFYTHSPKGFSDYVKKYFIESYSDHCELQNCYICNR